MARLTKARALCLESWGDGVGIGTTLDPAKLPKEYMPGPNCLKAFLEAGFKLESYGSGEYTKDGMTEKQLDESPMLPMIGFAKGDYVVTAGDGPLSLFKPPSDRGRVVVSDLGPGREGDTDYPDWRAALAALTK